MSMYSYFMSMFIHRASWHSSAILTEVFAVLFLSCKANASVKTHTEMGYGPHCYKRFVLFYVLLVLCRSVYCLCVNVYCTAATGWLPSCTQQIYKFTNSIPASAAKQMKPVLFWVVKRCFVVMPYRRFGLVLKGQEIQDP